MRGAFIHNLEEYVQAHESELISSGIFASSNPIEIRTAILSLSDYL
jgi:hypothetical protein